VTPTCGLDTSVSSFSFRVRNFPRRAQPFFFSLNLPLLLLLLFSCLFFLRALVSRFSLALLGIGSFSTPFLSEELEIGVSTFPLSLFGSGFVLFFTCLRLSFHFSRFLCGPVLPPLFWATASTCFIPPFSFSPPLVTKFQRFPRLDCLNFFFPGGSLLPRLKSPTLLFFFSPLTDKEGLPPPFWWVSVSVDFSFDFLSSVEAFPTLFGFPFFSFKFF